MLNVERLASRHFFSVCVVGLFCLSSVAVGAEEEKPKEKPAEQAAEELEMFDPAKIEFFEKKIRPLLIERCQDCHNAEESEGGLDLSSRAGIFKGGDSGTAFDQDHPLESLLLEAVSYKPDAIVEMPPDGRLSAEEVAALTKWVKEGMAWPGAKKRPQSGADKPTDDAMPFTEEQKNYWSFQVPQKAALPKVENLEWVKNGIDHFVLAQLEANNMQPAAPADKLTLMRRATYDLTGLPPTPEEISAYMNDKSEDAYQKLIERLLASKAYGERWGRHWLDVARYADTNGMDENLAYANAYLYRNYVIDAFNKDKPYDQFITEQLAGDLIPHPEDESITIERQIATGFLAVGPKMLAEDDPVKMHMDIIDEQIDTTGKAFMGLTLGCARCHDHKFDPVSTKDYYGLAGILKSTKTMNTYSVVAFWYERPVEPKARIAAYKAFEKARDEHQAAIDKMVKEANQQFVTQERLKVKEYLVAATDLLSARGYYQRLFDQWKQGAKPNVPGLQERIAEKFDRGNVDLLVQKTEPRFAPIATLKQGVSFAEYDFQIPKAGKYAILLSYAAKEKRPLKIAVNGKVAKDEGANQVTGGWGPNSQKWFMETVVELKEGLNTVNLECQKLFPHVSMIRLIPAGKFSENSGESFTSEGLAKSRNLNQHLLDQWVAYLKKAESDPKSIFKAWFEIEKSFQTQLAEGTSSHPLIQNRVKATLVHARQELATQYHELFNQASLNWSTLKSVKTEKEVKALPNAELEAFRLVLMDDKGPFKIPKSVENAYPEKVRTELAAYRAKLKEIKENAPPELQYAMGVTDFEIADTEICIRGNHVNLGPKVPRQFLSIVEGPDQTPIDDKQSGRLQLAKWLTKPDHPLTSRVMMNRIWRWHTGEGLVRTTDNFGLTGESPSHPKLLDWLAKSFQEANWSCKEMHRLIMNSATYQMSTAYNDDYAEKDPENKLIWRMNRKRLEAEAIRDSVLAVAGTIDRGDVNNLLKTKNHAYVNSTAGKGESGYDNEYRSVYLPIIRSSLFEMFQAFDFPDPSAMQGDRATTTVAPQALFMMNSEFMETQTEEMAKRLINEAPESETQRVERAYELIYGRKPKTNEMDETLAFLENYQEKVKEIVPEEKTREVSVWKGLCRILLSSNEFIYVD